MECYRCGRCCLELVPRTLWKVHVKDTEMMYEQRSRYPKSSVGCEMLVNDGGTMTCLVHQILGKEFKPKECLDYPEVGGGDLCKKEE